MSETEPTESKSTKLQTRDFENRWIATATATATKKVEKIAKRVFVCIA